MKQFRVRHVLAFLITVGFFGTMTYMLRYGVPTEGGEPLLVMIGGVAMAWSQIVSFYFGDTNRNVENPQK